MQKTFEARTEQEAIELAVREFGVNEDFLEVEVLEKSKNKLFNRNAKVTIRVSVHGLPSSSETNDSQQHEEIHHEEDAIREEASEEHKQQICKLVEDFITMLGIQVSCSFELEDNNYMVSLHTEESSDQNLLIGKHGKNIEAIQNIANSIIQKQVPDFNDFIVIDVEKYRKKREEWLSSIANKKAEQVLYTGKSYLLDELGPFDRKIVHRVIKNIDGIKTVSKGNGYYKRVQIYLES